MVIIKIASFPTEKSKLRPQHPQLMASNSASPETIKVIRWIARILAIIYVPFMLYGWVFLLYAVTQRYAGSLSVIYLISLIAETCLMAGYVLLSWREVAGSRVVLCSELVLVVARSPLVLGLHRLTMNNLGLMLGFVLPYIIIQLLFALLPVIILYFCRRTERRSARDQQLN